MEVVQSDLDYQVDHSDAHCFRGFPTEKEVDKRGRHRPEKTVADGFRYAAAVRVHLVDLTTVIL